MPQPQRSESRDRSERDVDRPRTRSGESMRDVTNDEISVRAYELYEQRGGEHGHDWDDWLEAERELQEERHTPGPTPS